MLAKVLTCAVVGLEGELVQVEVDIARQGISNFTKLGSYSAGPKVTISAGV